MTCLRRGHFELILSKSKTESSETTSGSGIVTKGKEPSPHSTLCAPQVHRLWVCCTRSYPIGRGYAFLSESVLTAPLLQHKQIKDGKSVTRMPDASLSSHKHCHARYCK